MTIIEKPEYFKKYRDKDGEYISLGDIVYGEDGKAFEVKQVVYEKGENYPIKGEPLKVTYTYKPLEKPVHLKPKWLTHSQTNEWQKAFDDVMREVEEVLHLLEDTSKEEEHINLLRAQAMLKNIMEKGVSTKLNLTKRDWGDLF